MSELSREFVPITIYRHGYKITYCQYGINQYGDIYDYCKRVIVSLFDDRFRLIGPSKNHYEFSLGSGSSSLAIFRPVHRIVYNTFVGDIPDGYHIHHKDKDPLNNSLSNLMCVSPIEHALLHPDVNPYFIINKKKKKGECGGKPVPSAN